MLEFGSKVLHFKSLLHFVSAITFGGVNAKINKVFVRESILTSRWASPQILLRCSILFFVKKLVQFITPVLALNAQKLTFYVQTIVPVLEDKDVNIQLYKM